MFFLPTYLPTYLSKRVFSVLYLVLCLSWAWWSNHLTNSHSQCNKHLTKIVLSWNVLPTTDPFINIHLTSFHFVLFVLFKFASFCFSPIPSESKQPPTINNNNEDVILHVLPPPPSTPLNQSLIAHCLEVTPPPPSIPSLQAPPLSSGESSSSRPSSQLSQNGSSGYGSTRSQVAPFGIASTKSNGVDDRPSPVTSSSSSMSTSSAEVKHFEKSKNLNKKVHGWSGGSLRGLPKKAQESFDFADVEGFTIRSATIHNPQFASLRIPNRIRHNSHGDLPAYVEEEDPGLDLAEAEVDSESEDLNNNNSNRILDPDPTPRVPKSSSNYLNMLYPLRHASSLESQVFLFCNSVTKTSYIKLCLKYYP